MRRLLTASALVLGLMLMLPGVANATPPDHAQGKGQGLNQGSNDQSGNNGKSDEAHENKGQEKKDQPETAVPTASTVPSQEDAVIAIVDSDTNQPTPASQPSSGVSDAPAKADPPGNNGTVKMDAVPFDSHPDNQPHVGCTFQVDFYNYDQGGNIFAKVVFELQSPTATGAIQVEGNVRPFIGGDQAGGGNDLDASETYQLKFPGVTPHPNQGVHVKLTVHAPGSQGADTKHKVFWVQPCGQPPVVIVTCPDGTPLPSKGNCPNPPVDVCPQDGVQTNTDECPLPFEEDDVRRDTLGTQPGIGNNTQVLYEVIERLPSVNNVVGEQFVEASVKQADVPSDEILAYTGTNQLLTTILGLALLVAGFGVRKFKQHL